MKYLPIQFHLVLVTCLFTSGIFVPNIICAEEGESNSDLFERKIRPLLVKHCYECHSEEYQEQMGGLLLDRESGWLNGGEMGASVVPGNLKASLIVTAIRYENDDLQMPPEKKLSKEEVELFEQWILKGAPGPRQSMGETEFSQLGDQSLLFEMGKTHWAFQPVIAPELPEVELEDWNKSPIDRLVLSRLKADGFAPSEPADPRTLLRRLYYDITGLPPTMEVVEEFLAASEVNRTLAIEQTVDRLLESPAFGEHFGRMWLDVARYADTDSFYRPDTRTAHYFPFAYTYRDYVILSFNSNKPVDQFIKEQLAADLMGIPNSSPEIAALGFLTVGPHANRNPTEAIDDWIDVTTRGLMGLTVACARCHDHKYQPIPTADYYSLHGVFSSITRIHPLDENRQPEIEGYTLDPEQTADYQSKREVIDEKIEESGNKKSKGNNRAIATKIKETELAELLLFHPGAPVRAMIVTEKNKPVEPVIFVRGEATIQGDRVPRRFLKILDAQQTPFPVDSSGRLQLAEQITSSENPLTSRVFVNRVWGQLMGSYLVETPSDFGVQTDAPVHAQLLDWLAADFMKHDWSLKHLVRNIVLSQAYQQSSQTKSLGATLDPQNRLYWRANRKHLSLEAIRDSLLHVSGSLDLTLQGHAAPLWGDGATHRRAIYGYVNRFNLDPTLRAFDFPTPMQTQPQRTESIVAPQSLFTMNSPFVIEQAKAITRSSEVARRSDRQEKISAMFESILQRHPEAKEVEQAESLLGSFDKLNSKTDHETTVDGWSLLAQSLLMSNEFQYID